RIFCAYWPEWMWKNDDIKNDQSLNRCFERRNCYRWSTYWRLRYSRIALGDWLCTATNRPVSAHDNCRNYCDRSCIKKMEYRKNVSSRERIARHGWSSPSNISLPIA